MRKVLKKITIISFLLILLIYVSNINAISDNYILFQGENLNISTVFGISLDEKDSNNPNIRYINNYIARKTSISVSNREVSSTDDIGKVELSLNIFGKIPLKTVTVNVIPRTKVVPVGNIVGLKLYTNGVLVVGMSEILGENSEKYKPYEKSGIKEGDLIIEINSNKINNKQDLIKMINSSSGNEIDIKYVRDGAIYTTNIVPAKTFQDEYKIGLWVRDTAAGVGTFTFYEPESKMFAALGHGIIDIDTEELVNIANGDIVTTNIVSIQKGEKGKPGEIKGTVERGVKIGQVYKNTEYGIYGMLDNPSVLNIDNSQAIEVALRDEIKTGPAKILCKLEDGTNKEFNIEIQKLFLKNNENNKSMLIKITDKELIELTGGIIQGMSGSPIVQDGKFIGSVTHVLVDDPTIGYGVFADIMIKQLKEVN